jgi:hypothetical protein
MRKHIADGRMNCLQCCLAGMFDLELEEVPGAHAWSKEGYWFDGMYRWSKAMLKHTPIAVTDDTLDGLFHIAVVEADGVSHAVIAYGPDIVWDPNPTPTLTNLDTIDYSLVFVPFNGLSVQQACRLSYVNDWRDEALGTMRDNVLKDIQDG